LLYLLTKLGTKFDFYQKDSKDISKSLLTSGNLDVT